MHDDSHHKHWEDMENMTKEELMEKKEWLKKKMDWIEEKLEKLGESEKDE